MKARAEKQRKKWDKQLKLAKQAEAKFSIENERYHEFLGNIAGLEKCEYYGIRTAKHVDPSSDNNNIEVRETEW